MLYGRTQNNPASRFIGEISAEYLQDENEQVQGSAQAEINIRLIGNETPGQLLVFTVTNVLKYLPNQGTGAEKVSWAAGDKVQHKAWGVGTVVKVSGTGEDVEIRHRL